MSSVTRCSAITEAGNQCSRNATINRYCTQHYKKLEQELPPDITNNILSNYIEIEELKELENEFEGLKLDPKRIEIKEQFYGNGKVRHRDIYHDGILSKKEDYYGNGKQYYLRNYKNGKSEGKQYYWHINGKMESEQNYENGNKEGKSYTWYESGKMESEKNYIKWKI